MSKWGRNWPFIGIAAEEIECVDERKVFFKNLIDRNLVLQSVLLRLLTDTLVTTTSSRTALTLRTKRGY